MTISLVANEQLYLFINVQIFTDDSLSRTETKSNLLRVSSFTFCWKHSSFDIIVPLMVSVISDKCCKTLNKIKDRM